MAAGDMAVEATVEAVVAGMAAEAEAATGRDSAALTCFEL